MRLSLFRPGPRQTVGRLAFKNLVDVAVAFTFALAGLALRRSSSGGLRSLLASDHLMLNSRQLSVILDPSRNTSATTGRSCPRCERRIISTVMTSMSSRSLRHTPETKSKAGLGIDHDEALTMD